MRTSAKFISALALIAAGCAVKNADSTAGSLTACPAAYSDAAGLPVDCAREIHPGCTYPEGRCGCDEVCPGPVTAVPQWTCRPPNWPPVRRCFDNHTAGPTL